MAEESKIIDVGIIQFPGGKSGGECSWRDLGTELWERVKELMVEFDDPKRFDHDFNRACQSLLLNNDGRREECLEAIRWVQKGIVTVMVRGAAQTIKDEDLEAEKNGKEQDSDG